MTVALGAAVALLMIAFVGALMAEVPRQRGPVKTISAASRPEPVDAAASTTDVPYGWWTYLSLQPQLDLPTDAGDVVLTSIPDRYLNDPLPAAFLVPVRVRGTTGIAAVGPPASLVWTEGYFSYSLSSPTLSIANLVEVASALR